MYLAFAPEFEENHKEMFLLHKWQLLIVLSYYVIITITYLQKKSVYSKSHDTLHIETKEFGYIIYALIVIL